MYRLLLVRHAKAAWARPGMRDFDRPLTAAGRADAQLLGRQMNAFGYVPDAVLCSTAKRARETWDHMAPSLGSGPGRLDLCDMLYGTDAAGYLAAIQAAPAAEALMVVGHNPNMEDLAFALASPNDDAYRPIASGFPACGLAVFEFDRPLTEIGPGTGRLKAFLVPQPS